MSSSFTTDKYPITIRIVRETDIYLAMQEADNLASEIGFRVEMVLRIKTAVSELARNIIKYAGKGRVVLAPLQGERNGIEILVSDMGPGIKDVNTAMQENYSTSGTLGLGLPGVKRMMDEFEIDSQHDKGTRIKAIKWLS